MTTGTKTAAPDVAVPRSGMLWARLHSPGSMRQLAVLRILFGCYIFWLLTSDVFPTLAELRPQLRLSTWSFLPGPLIEYTLEHLVGVLVVVGMVSTVLVVVGLGYRVSIVVSGIAFLLLYAVYYRTTKSHTEWPYWFFTYVVFSLAPAADVWSADSAILARRGRSVRRNSQSYRWPIEMMVLWIGITYGAGGIAKLFPLRAGVEWLRGDMIQWLSMTLYHDSPIHWFLGAPLFDYGIDWPWAIMAILAVITELSALTFLFTRRLYAPVILGLLGLHTGIYAMTGVSAFVFDAAVCSLFLIPPEIFPDFGRDS